MNKTRSKGILMNGRKQTILLPVMVVCLMGLLLELNASRARAAQVAFSFIDAVGDVGFGSVDLVRMDMTFDNTTGAYRIDLYADQSKPFVGEFRVNVNLYNPDAHSADPAAQWFTDNLNDFNLTEATTNLTLSGEDVRLVSWNVGDRVAAR